MSLGGKNLEIKFLIDSIIISKLSDFGGVNFNFF